MLPAKKSDLCKFYEIANLLPGVLLVGGTVRNFVLANSCAKSDLDLLITCCDLTATQYLASKVPNVKILVSKHDSRARAMLPCGTVFDLNVTPLSFSQDASGRDFTINALALNLNHQVLDPLHAFSDLSSCIIRTCGNPLETLLADPARIARALRFKSQLSAQTGKQWELDLKLRLCMSDKVNTLCAAIRSSNNSAMKNEVLKLLSAAPSHVLYKDLQKAPAQLVTCLLEHAKGKFSLC